jgi:hypothetical protein
LAVSGLLETLRYKRIVGRNSESIGSLASLGISIFCNGILDRTARVGGTIPKEHGKPHKLGTSRALIALTGEIIELGRLANLYDVHFI